MKGKMVGNRFYLYDNGWVQVTKEEFDAAIPPVDDSVDGLVGNRPWAKPVVSDALAVHPSQIEEVMARNKRHGLEVEYEGEYGRPILRDRDQRRRLLKIERCHDNNGGYGDG